MATLPTVDGDQNTWGTELNEFLSVYLASDGVPRAVYTDEDIVCTEEGIVTV